MVNTDDKNYTKTKWDWKDTIPIQSKADCSLYPKGQEPGPDEVEKEALSGAKALTAGALGIIVAMDFLL